jgi:hypothetical protein
VRAERSSPCSLHCSHIWRNVALSDPWQWQPGPPRAHCCNDLRCLLPRIPKSDAVTCANAAALSAISRGVPHIVGGPAGWLDAHSQTCTVWTSSNTAARRALYFTDFPLGNPCGHPWRRDMQPSIVALALRSLADAAGPRSTMRTPFGWKDDHRLARLLRSRRACSKGPAFGAGADTPQRAASQGSGICRGSPALEELSSSRVNKVSWMK